VFALRDVQLLSFSLKANHTPVFKASRLRLRIPVFFRLILLFLFYWVGRPGGVLACLEMKSYQLVISILMPLLHVVRQTDDNLLFTHVIGNLVIADSESAMAKEQLKEVF